MNTGNTQTGRKPSQLHPLTLIGAIFSGLGLLFAVLGGAFLGMAVEMALSGFVQGEGGDFAQVVKQSRRAENTGRISLG